MGFFFLSQKIILLPLSKPVPGFCKAQRVFSHCQASCPVDGGKAAFAMRQFAAAK
jgi:hypothetical protein